MGQNEAFFRIFSSVAKIAISNSTISLWDMQEVGNTDIFTCSYHAPNISKNLNQNYSFILPHNFTVVVLVSILTQNY